MNNFKSGQQVIHQLRGPGVIETVTPAGNLHIRLGNGALHLASPVMVTRAAAAV